MAKEEYIQICPICGSKKIGFYVDNKGTEAGILEMYECKRCKNIFAFPLEVEKKKANKIAEVPLNSKILRSTTEEAVAPIGKFEVGVFWKINGAVMALLGLFYILSAFMPGFCYLENFTGVCIPNTMPIKQLIIGLGIVSAGAYLIIESYSIANLKQKQSTLLKIGIVMALIIIATFPVLGML
jgi:hypothetical protein